jgi:hypothetical protein
MVEIKILQSLILPVLAALTMMALTSASGSPTSINRKRAPGFDKMAQCTVSQRIAGEHPGTQIIMNGPAPWSFLLSIKESALDQQRLAPSGKLSPMSVIYHLV